MTEQLIIYLKDIDSLQADWIFTNLAGDISTPINSGSIAELAEKDKNNILAVQKTTCIICSDQIHFSYQKIPAKSIQKALQAIPFVLEDQLAEDINQMHFATTSAKNNTYPVAAIKHETLQTLLDKLAEFNIKPDYIHPDICCLPQSDNSWNLLHHDDKISIDQHRDSLIHTDRDSFSIILNSLIKQLDDDHLPDSITLWSAQDTEALVLPEGLAATLDIIKNDYDTSPISIFSKQLNNKGLVNLLQGRFKIIRQSNSWWKAWRVAAVLIIAVVLLELVAGSLQLNSLEAENTLLNSEINRIYKKSFPRSKRIVNARVQMENKLKKLKKGNNKGSVTFTDLLVSSSPIIQQTSGLDILAINFSNKKMEVEFSIDKLSSVEKLKSRLNSVANLKAELISSSSDAKRVNAKIKIEAL